jgi:hypothetical protein
MATRRCARRLRAMLPPPGNPSPREASLTPIDCPINSDLFHPLGPTTNIISSDPNAALWLSIRPSPPPSWSARLRQGAARFSVAMLRTRLRRGWPSWIASHATARDWVSSTAVGLLLGLGVGFAGRSASSEPPPVLHAAAEHDTNARPTPRVVTPQLRETEIQEPEPAPTTLGPESQVVYPLQPSAPRRLQPSAPRRAVASPTHHSKRHALAKRRAKPKTRRASKLRR